MDYDEAQGLIRGFEHATIDHNYRNKNALADKLANLAMDRKADVTDAGDAGGKSPSPLDAPSPVAPKAGDQMACPRCSCVIRVERPSSLRPHQLKPFVCQCGTKMNLREA